MSREVEDIPRDRRVALKDRFRIHEGQSRHWQNMEDQKKAHEDEEFARQREATRKKVASLPREERIRKASLILGMRDGTTVNSRVCYLADHCGMDFNEILIALDDTIQSEVAWV
jgi:hypothetical protein